MNNKNKWEFNGIKIVSENDLDDNTPQTKGMKRFAAIAKSNVGAEKIWAGKVNIEPSAKTGAHHHGELESVIYVLSGKAKMRWGEKLEFEQHANPGDFIFVPPFVPHQATASPALTSQEFALRRLIAAPACFLRMHPSGRSRS